MTTKTAALVRQYEKSNPFRDPAWRQRRVVSLVEATPPRPVHRRVDDIYIKRYYRFYRDWRRTRNENERMLVFQRDPAVCYAHQFAENPDREWRAILDARILAREPDDYIAMEFDTLPSTIDLYEKLFFNVRDRLHSRTYIVKTITGPDGLQPAADTILDKPHRLLAYKLFAYFGGPLVLDILLHRLPDRDLPTTQEAADEFMATAYRRSVRDQATLVSQFMPVNRFSMMQLLEIQQKFVAMDIEASQKGGGAGRDYVENVSKFFEQLQLTIGKASNENQTPQTLEFFKTNVEPRADEQLELSRGVVPDSLRLKLAFSREQPREVRARHDDNTSGTDDATDGAAGP